MLIDQKNTILPQAIYLPSPFFDARPQNMVIDTIIIHGISLPRGVFGTSCVQDLFLGRLNLEQYPELHELKNVKVSSHLFINRSGELIQFVPFDQRAWHAGVSHFQGRKRCNDFSIGIELEGTDDLPYERVQYTKLVECIAEIRANYPIHRNHIVGHSDVAPGRKTDPGPHFNWSMLNQLLNQT